MMKALKIEMLLYVLFILLVNGGEASSPESSNVTSDCTNNETVYIIIMSISIVVAVGLLIDDIRLRRAIQKQNIDNCDTSSINTIKSSTKNEDLATSPNFGEYVMIKQTSRKDDTFKFDQGAMYSAASYEKIAYQDTHSDILRNLDREDVSLDILQLNNSPELNSGDQLPPVGEPPVQHKRDPAGNKRDPASVMSGINPLASEPDYVYTDGDLNKDDPDLGHISNGSQYLFSKKRSKYWNVSNSGDYRKVPHSARISKKKGLVKKKEHMHDHEREELMIKADQIKIDFENSVGKGRFGTVYKGLYRAQLVALKRLSSHELTREFHLFYRASLHPSICRIFGVYECLEHVDVKFIVMEYFKLGNLKDYIQKHKMDDVKKYYIMVMLAAGLHHLHEEGIVHGDLALRNVLVNMHYSRTCISDFGLAKHCAVDQVETVCQPSFAPRWASPELVKNHITSCNSDVWAMGIVFMELLSNGEKPYKTMTTRAVVEHLRQGGRPHIDEALYSEPGKKFIIKILNATFADESDRINAKKLTEVVVTESENYIQNHSEFHKCTVLKEMAALLKLSKEKFGVKDDACVNYWNKIDKIAATSSDHAVKPQ